MMGSAAAKYEGVGVDVHRVAQTIVHPQYVVGV
jgi:hypothetical protein